MGVCKLKLSVHTDVLISNAKSLSGLANSEKSALALFERADLEFWAPALCIAKALEKVAEKHGSECSRLMLQFVQEHISIVPLRNLSFSDYLRGEISNIEIAGHMSVHALVGIEAVLSDTLGTSDLNGLACVTVDQLQARRDEQPCEKVPFLDLKAQFPKVYNEVDDRFTEIMSNTAFILGPHVEEFEKAFAKLQGAKHCIGLSSGTDALHLACMALNIGPGDKVIVPANTFIATAEGVSLAGATPVFVDSNDKYNIDIAGARRLLEKSKKSDRIRAIMPVHLYGQPADLDAVEALAQEFDIVVIEDCAQAHLAKFRGKQVGNFGICGAFSFYPGKNLGAYGEAGALVTNDDELAQKFRMLRAHGEQSRYRHSVVGHNYRMEALQGAVLATKVKFITEWTSARQRIARDYCARLANNRHVMLPEEYDHARSVHHLFVIQVDDRNGLQEHLTRNGIASGLHYPQPLHLQIAYADLGYRQGDFPVAEAQAERILSLPMYPELTERQVEKVCSSIEQYYAGK